MREKMLFFGIKNMTHGCLYNKLHISTSILNNFNTHTSIKHIF